MAREVFPNAEVTTPLKGLGGNMDGQATSHDIQTKISSKHDMIESGQSSLALAGTFMIRLSAGIQT